MYRLYTATIEWHYASGFSTQEIRSPVIIEVSKAVCESVRNLLEQNLVGISCNITHFSITYCILSNHDFCALEFRLNVPEDDKGCCYLALNLPAIDKGFYFFM